MRRLTVFATLALVAVAAPAASQAPTVRLQAYAYDVETGEQLWETRLPTSVQGFPITYAVDGKQYVALPAGIGGGSWTTIPLELTPEKRRPNGGNGLFVFA